MFHYDSVMYIRKQPTHVTGTTFFCSHTKDNRKGNNMMIDASPFAQFPKGEVIYKKSTSRVYSLKGNCAEEVSMLRDNTQRLEEISVTRVLNQRSTTFIATRDTASNDREIRRSGVNVKEEEEPEFDREWMEVASRFLPPYNQQGRAIRGDTNLQQQWRGEADRWQGHIPQQLCAESRNSVRRINDDVSRHRSLLATQRGGRQEQQLLLQ